MSSGLKMDFVDNRLMYRNVFTYIDFQNTHIKLISLVIHFGECTAMLHCPCRYECLYNFYDSLRITLSMV
jgi:hypothetical protein